MNRTIQVFLNIVAIVVSLVFFTILLFPLDAVISHELSRIEKQTKGQWRASVASIDASLLFDTEFTEFKLYQNNQEVFSAPKMDVGVSLFSLISGKVNVRFKALFKKGSLTGHVIAGTDALVDLEFKDFSIADFSYVSVVLKNAGFPMTLSGVVNGTFYFAGAGVDQQAEAAANLKIKDVELESVSILSMGIELPQLVLAAQNDALEIDVDLGRGQLLINRINIPGPDLTLSLNGNATLDRTQNVSRMTLDGKFSFSELVKSKVALLTAFDNQKTSDGFYPLSIKGTLKAPKIKVGDFDLSAMQEALSRPIEESEIPTDAGTITPE